MQIFITYAREDRARAAALVHDLERAQHSVWIDNALTGGQVWWDAILDQIARCEIYLFLVSSASLVSRACGAELGYAGALHRSIVQVLVEDVDPARLDAYLAGAPSVDLHERTPESLIALVTVLASQPPSPPLPDPLPARPAVPITYLRSLHDRVTATALPAAEQADIVARVASYLDAEDEQHGATALLQQLRQRSDLTRESARAIDALLADIPGLSAVRGPRHPSTVPIALLAAMGVFTAGITGIIASVIATRALSDVDAHPGRFRNRRALVVLRICGVLSIAGAVLYYIFISPGSG